MNFIIHKKHFWTFISLLCYRVMLDISYRFFISDTWEYAGFKLNFNIFKLIESYILFFIIIFLIPKSKKNLSNIIIWVLVLLAYVPMLTLYALKNEARIFIYMATLFWMIIFLFKYFLNQKVKISSLKQNKTLSVIIIFIVSIITGLLLFKKFNPFITFNLRDVYGIRSQYEEIVTLGGYIFSWMANIIIPFLIVLSVVKKKRFYLIPLFIFQILLFSISGHKSYFFLPLFALTLAWIVKRKNPLNWMCSGLILVIIIGIGFYWIQNDLLIMSLFTRRTLFISPFLSFRYYEFFSNNSFVYLSHHQIFNKFLTYPYELIPAKLIGKIYRNGSHSNNGMMSDGYMNFGFMGMMLWAIFYSIIFKIIDIFSYKKNLQIATSITAFLCLSLRSGALLTNIFTEGLLLSIFLLYLLPKK